MILEPRKSAKDVDRRLAALTDAELAELLRGINREFRDDEPESYTSPTAPYWKKRIALVALAGLMAMSAGFSAAVSTVHERPKPTAKIVPPPIVATRHHASAIAPIRRHHVAARHVAVRHAAAPVHHAFAVAPDVQSEALIRRARAAMLHEQALAAQAQVQAQRRAQANEQALEEALAQARAQARAEAIANARAQALENAQAQELEAAQQEALRDNAADPNIKPGAGVPPGDGGMSTVPTPNNPIPAPGPVLDPSCTPHRGAFLTGALDRVRLGGTSVGAVLRLIHH